MKLLNNHTLLKVFHKRNGLKIILEFQVWLFLSASAWNVFPPPPKAPSSRPGTRLFRCPPLAWQRNLRRLGPERKKYFRCASNYLLFSLTACMSRNIQKIYLLVKRILNQNRETFGLLVRWIIGHGFLLDTNPA